MDKKKLKNCNKGEAENGSLSDIIKRIICPLVPVVSAFCGYLLSQNIWTLMNQTTSVTEVFKFICSVIFFAIPSIVIFIETRKLNPIIKITIKENK